MIAEEATKEKAMISKRGVLQPNKIEQSFKLEILRKRQKSHRRRNPVKFTKSKYKQNKQVTEKTLSILLFNAKSLLDLRRRRKFATAVE